MRYKRILLILVAIFSLVEIHSQTIASENMDSLVRQCKRIIELKHQIDSINSEMASMQKRISKGKKEWLHICENYIESGDQSKEDFDKLISQTDSISEQTLRAKLIAASRNIKVGGKPYKAPTQADSSIKLKENGDGSYTLHVSTDPDGKSKGGDENKKVDGVSEGEVVLPPTNDDGQVVKGDSTKNGKSKHPFSEIEKK